MKRLTLIALATAGLAFAATPSYAQSSYGGNTGDSYGNSAADTSAEKEALRAERAQRKAEKKRLKAEKKAMAVQDATMKEKGAMKDHSSATDAKMMKEDGTMMVKDHSSSTDAKMMKQEGATMVKGHSSSTGATMMKEDGVMMEKGADKMMMKGETSLPTNCPSGTTPQTNGTCMLN